MCLVCWKSILELDFFYQLQKLDTVIHNEICHQSRDSDIADRLLCLSILVGFVLFDLYLCVYVL